jgi:hypothetical protein
VKSDDRRTMPWEVDNLHLVAVELLIKALLWDLESPTVHHYHQLNDSMLHLCRNKFRSAGRHRSDVRASVFQQQQNRKSLSRSSLAAATIKLPQLM